MIPDPPSPSRVLFLRYGSGNAPQTDNETLRIARGLSAREWDAHAAFLGSDDSARERGQWEAAGISAWCPTAEPAAQHLPLPARLYRETVRAIRSIEPDVVFLPVQRPVELLASALACARLHTPCSIVVQRTLPFNRVGLPARLAMRWARRRGQSYVAASERNAADLSRSLRIGAGIETAPNGIDRDSAASSVCDSREGRDRARGQLGIAANKILVLSAGPCTAENGDYDWLDTSRRVAALDADVLFVWVGGGSETVSLCRSLVAGPMQSQIRMLPDELSWPLLLAASDIFFCSSRYASGAPTKLLEAMRAGLPIVSTDAGGIAEVIRDGGEGVIVSAGDAAGCMRAIRELARDSARARSLASAAQRRAGDFTLEEMVARHERVLLDLLARSGAARARRRHSRSALRNQTSP